ncbi:helix-turn-helix domain-containing protein [Armatimonas sp.]|uniref:helix-turn-helix domain-containing protein n=1 Tax=Armatimonas sp. TaxID=1872638 RepID=UPI00286C2425|nr:helix-turn-helix domain-containing protein [Armatimonas sp.]
MVLASETLTVGQQLQQWRLRRGFSLGALSLRCGIHKSTLSRWERGIQSPSMRELEAALSVLDVPTHEAAVLRRQLDTPRAILYRHQESPDESQVSGGELLRMLRLRAGMTQGDAARKVGVARELLSRWERGGGWPDGQKLHALCFALQATVEETLHLTTRAWQAQTPLPNDKEALDCVLQNLQQADSMERNLSYLALASRYDALYRAGKLSEAEATAIWGHYGMYHDRCHYYSRYHQHSAHLAAPALRSIRSSTAPLKSGQVAALTLIVGALLEQEKPSEALQLVNELHLRLPAAQRARYPYLVARILEHSGQIDEAVQQWEKYISDAGSSSDFSIRQQHFVAMLCRHGRYSDAARQLAPPLPNESHLWSLWENQLHHAWVLGGLGELAEAQRYLQRVLPLVQQSGSEYLKDLGSSLSQWLTR